MHLYTFYQSSTSYRVRIGLNLKGLAPAMDYVDLTQGEQKSDAYSKISAQKNVPTLIDQGQHLSQSLAILEYLDEAYLETYPLLPNDPLTRAHARSLALLIAADISPLGNLKVRKYLQGPMQQSEADTIAFINHWIAEGFATLESILATSSYTGKFCIGDAPGMVDCCLIPQVFTARRWKLDLAPYPSIQRIAEACDAHPAFIAAHPSNQADAKK